MYYVMNSRELEDVSEQEFEEVVLREWQDVSRVSSTNEEEEKQEGAEHEEENNDNNNDTTRSNPNIQLVLSKDYRMQTDGAAFPQLVLVDEQGRELPMIQYPRVANPKLVVPRTTRVLQSTTSRASISILMIQMPLHSHFATQAQADEMFETLRSDEWPNLWCFEISAPFHPTLKFHPPWNTITIVPSFLQLLSPPDRYFKKIRRVELSHYKIGNDTCAQLIRILASHNNAIHSLYLRNNQLTRLNDNVIHDLTMNTKLQTLCLDQNPLDEMGQEAIAELIRHPHSKLRWLSLNLCGITNQGCNAILEALHLNHMLWILDWTHNRFDIEQAEARLLTLLDASNLTLYRASFVDGGMNEELQKRLLENESLKQLVTTCETHDESQSNESIDNVLPLLLSKRLLVQTTSLFVLLRQRPDQLRALVAALVARLEEEVDDQLIANDGKPSAKRKAA